MEGSFETSNEVIVNWIETKLRDTCRCISLFTNYILIPRYGFIKHTHPTLLLPIVKYVIEEILNCRIVSSKSEHVSFPNDFSVKCKKYLSEDIRTKITIGYDTVEYLWKYISIGVASLTEDINLAKEVRSKKSQKKRLELMKRKEALDEFKKSQANTIEARDYSLHKLRSYKYLRNKILSAIKSSRENITKYEKDKNHRTYNTILVFTLDDKELLDELGVNSKRVKRMETYSDFEITQNKDRDDNSFSRADYVATMKELLKKNIDTLERIIGEINTGDVVKSIPKKIWEGDSLKLDNTEIKKFIREINNTLGQRLKEIDEGTDIKVQTEKRLMNKIKTRIDTFQSYISHKPCDDKSFDRDIDNCILQSIVYIVVTLTDWLETDRVSSIDIMCALRILLPLELESYIPLKAVNDGDDKFKTEFVKRIVGKYKLIIKSEDYNKIDIISGTIKAIDKLDPASDQYRKFNNRVRYFARKI